MLVRPEGDPPLTCARKVKDSDWGAEVAKQGEEIVKVEKLVSQTQMKV